MPILPSDVQKAIYIVESHGADRLLQDALRFDGRGRKSPVTPRLFLIGAILTAQSRRNLVMADIHRTLTEGLDHDSQVLLGVRDTHLGPSRLKVAAFERFSAMLSTRLEYGMDSAPDISDEERERRYRAVLAVTDALLDATLPERTFSAYALDTSAFWAWGRARKSAPTTLVERDAAIRESGQDDHDPAHDSDNAPGDAVGSATADPADLKVPYELDARWGMKTAKDGSREAVYGFDLHALVRAPDTGCDRNLEANLIERIDVTPAGQDIVEPSLRVIDRVIAAGRVCAELLADRHYSYKLAERWAIPLTDRNIEQVVDLHANDQGFRDYNGAKLAAGWLHCPKTAEQLGTIRDPGPGANRAQREEFNKTIAKRQQFALGRISIKNGRRFQCPALAGTVGCPLRAGSVEAAVELGLPVVTDPPERSTAPKCCTQATVELKEDGQRKLWQREYWGSKRWKLSNNRRTFVEGAFGNLKNPSGEDLRRGYFRITGQARITLLLGVTATAHNARQLSNWHVRTGNGDPTHPLLAPDSDGVAIHLSLDRYAEYERFREWEAQSRAIAA